MDRFSRSPSDFSSHASQTSISLPDHHRQLLVSILCPFGGRPGFMTDDWLDHFFQDMLQNNVTLNNPKAVFEFFRKTASEQDSVVRRANYVARNREARIPQARGKKTRVERKARAPAPIVGDAPTGQRPAWLGQRPFVTQSSDYIEAFLASLSASNVDPHNKDAVILHHIKFRSSPDARPFRNKPILAKASHKPIIREARTPLMIAADHGDATKIKTLLQNDIDSPGIVQKISYQEGAPDGSSHVYNLIKATKLYLSHDPKECIGSDAYVNEALIPMLSTQKYGGADRQYYGGANVLTRAIAKATDKTSASTQELVIALCKNGADVNEMDENGDIPLTVACACGRFELAKALIELGADVNLANARGQTPLMLAVFKGELEMVKHLLTLGANPLCLNQNGASSLSLCTAVGGVLGQQLAAAILPVLINDLRAQFKASPTIINIINEESAGGKTQKFDFLVQTFKDLLELDGLCNTEGSAFKELGVQAKECVVNLLTSAYEHLNLSDLFVIIRSSATLMEPFRTVLNRATKNLIIYWHICLKSQQGDGVGRSPQEARFKTIINRLSAYANEIRVPDERYPFKSRMGWDDSLRILIGELIELSLTHFTADAIINIITDPTNEIDINLIDNVISEHFRKIKTVIQNTLNHDDLLSNPRSCKKSLNIFIQNHQKALSLLTFCSGETSHIILRHHWFFAIPLDICAKLAKMNLAQKNIILGASSTTELILLQNFVSENPKRFISRKLRISSKRAQKRIRKSFSCAKSQRPKATTARRPQRLRPI